jgi:SET family sugar efflux transporter-like MFS transporter
VPIRSLAPLGGVVVLVGLIDSFVLTFLPLFVSRDLDASPALVSLFLFGMPVAAVVAATVVGRLSDRAALRPRLLVLAAGTGCIGFLFFALLRNYWASLAMALTFIAVATSLMPQVFAFSRMLLDRVYPSRAATGISSLRSLVSVAWVAGPPLAAYLIGATGFRGLFIVVAVMHLAVLPVLIRIRVPETAGAGHEAIQSDASAAIDGPTVPATGHLLGAGAAFVLLQCASALGLMSTPFFVSVDLKGNISDAGLILGLCAALEIPLMLAFGVLAMRLSPRHLVLLGAGIGIAYFVAVTLTGAVWHIAAIQILNACFIAAVLGLGMAYFQDLMPTRPGRATTMFANTSRLSVMLAGLVFGVVQVVGYRFAYLIGAGLCTSGLALLALLRPTTQDRSLACRARTRPRHAEDPCATTRTGSSDAATSRAASIYQTQ